MIITEKAPYGVMTSNVYEVTVIQGDKCEKSDVYLTVCPSGKGKHIKLPEEYLAEYNGITDGGPETIICDKAYFTGFTTDMETEVKVKINLAFEKLQVIGKAYKLEGSTVSFTMCPGEKAVILLGDDFGDHLIISADKEYAIPADAERLVELKAGLYTADNCEYITLNSYGAPVFSVPNNTAVYLHRSAVINAAVYLEGKHNVKIMGYGIISTVDRCFGADKEFNAEPRYAPLRKGAVPSVYIKTDCSDISVEGVTLSCEFRGICVRNSKNIKVDNVKAYTGCINADGINMMNVVNMKISNTVVVSADDCIALFTACDSIKFLDDAECKSPVPYTANIEIKDCILATAARVFCIGGHSTGNKTPHDLLENLHAYGVKGFRIGSLAYPVNHAKFWSGPIRILSQTEQYIRNIKIENMTMHQHSAYCGKLIHIEVRSDKEASYTETNGYRIENVEITNVDFDANSDIILPCLIKSQSEVAEEGYCVDGVHIKNVLIAGRQLENIPELLETAGPVKNLTTE